MTFNETKIRKSLGNFSLEKVKAFFPQIESNINKLENIQNYKYKDRALAAMALIHRSCLVYWPQDKSGVISNEKLEFLGDSFLNYFIAVEAVTRFPSWQEGDLSKLRAALVGAEYLAMQAKKISLDSIISMGKGELLQSSTNRNSLYADAFEAITASLLIDAGEKNATAWLHSIYEKDLALGEQILNRFDAKSRFQQWVQSLIGKPPVYRVVGELTNEQRVEYVVAAFIGNKELARAHAVNRRLASKMVAVSLCEMVERKELTEEMVKKAAVGE